MTLTQKQQSALNVLALLAIAALIFFIPGAYAGGLDAATDKANEVKTWLYGFILVATLIYAMYCIIMALIFTGSMNGNVKTPSFALFALKNSSKITSKTKSGTGR